MPRIGITAYDLLISCPGDVIEYLDVIKESVESFNRVFGRINNIEIVTKHWSTDSYPQSGDKPQELLNKQLVRDCDAAVALFWTRFGTPTDKYASGTEEEIEEMLSAGKQVFMYFLDVPVNPSQVDMEQYKKIIDFREKYKDKGIYAIIKDKEELRRQFTNHLAMYFLSIISDNNVTNSKKLLPILQIRDVNAISEEQYYLYNSSLRNSKFIKEKKEDIIKNIHSIQNNSLPKRTQVVLEDEKIIKETPEFLKNIEIKKLLENVNIPSISLKDADIPNSWKETISKFAEENQVKINDDFWNVGDLKMRIPSVVLPFGNSGSVLEGTDEEKERYDLLRNLYWDIVSYNEYIDYFSYIDKLNFAKLAISNSGHSFDEDIDVKLIIPKGYALKHLDLPYPGINIIEELLDMEFIDYLFSIQESDIVEGYAYYPVLPPPYEDILSVNPFNKTSISEEYKKHKVKYKNSLERIFNYKIFESEENDIFIFHIGYLKHNTTMAFPSVLIFKDPPKFIDYEITSKYQPEVIKGRINFNEKRKDR